MRSPWLRLNLSDHATTTKKKKKSIKMNRNKFSSLKFFAAADRSQLQPFHYMPQIYNFVRMCMRACRVVIRTRRNRHPCNAGSGARSRKWWIEYDLNGLDHSESCVCVCGVHSLHLAEHHQLPGYIKLLCCSSCSRTFHFIHTERPARRACSAKLETHLPSQGIENKLSFGTEMMFSFSFLVQSDEWKRNVYWTHQFLSFFAISFAMFLEKFSNFFFFFVFFLRSRVCKHKYLKNANE